MKLWEYASNFRALLFVGCSKFQMAGSSCSQMLGSDIRSSDILTQFSVGVNSSCGGASIGDPSCFVLRGFLAETEETSKFDVRVRPMRQPSVSFL